MNEIKIENQQPLMPVTDREIPKLCRQVAAGNSPEVVALAMQTLVPVINKNTMDFEIGEPTNLLSLISVVEHIDLSYENRRL